MSAPKKRNRPKNQSVHTVYVRVNTTDAKEERKESLERDRQMRERIKRMAGE